MNRELDVWLEDDRAGRLHENTGIWSFDYDARWLTEGFPLAPGLPLQADPIVDGGTHRPVQWFFDNLLPEESARTRLVASLEKGDWDSWRLLERFGAESAGALTLLPPGEALPAASLKPLPDNELNARIAALPRTALGSAAPKRMSLAGAQEKLPVVLDDTGQLFEPVGAQISTHILKPDVASEHYPFSAVNEWFCARVAQELGLSVPPVALRFVPSCIYLIERFDRLRGDGRMRRRHTLDAAQLLSLAAGAKYAHSGVTALRDVVALCRARAPTRVALFRWTVFNALIGNGGAHLKNISLFAGRDGYTLAPHYDLINTAAWARPELAGQNAAWPNVELSYPLGDAHTFAALRPAHLFEFATELGLPRSAAQREIGNLVWRVGAAADAVLSEFECRDVPPAMQAGLRHMLRSIRHLPIADMQRQLSIG